MVPVEVRVDDALGEEADGPVLRRHGEGAVLDLLRRPACRPG
jgi:hypothetical protein